MILCENLKMQRIATCRVLHFLPREQRDHCIVIFCEWLKNIEDEFDVMRCVITGDESGFTTLIQPQNRKACIGSLNSLQ